MVLGERLQIQTKLIGLFRFFWSGYQVPIPHVLNWGGGEDKINWNWELASSRTGPEPDFIVPGSFLNELK